MSTDKKSFILFTDMRKSVDGLSDEDAGKLFKLILAYESGDEILPTGSVGTAFTFGFQPRLDANRESYEKRCEANRANGAKGGRPRKVETEDKTSELFDEFWRAYPRHDAKQTAVKAFRKVSEKLLRETILPDLEKRKASEQWTKDNGAYIPHAATYINQQRWQDQITKSKTRATRNNQYEQRKVSDEDYSDLFLNLDEESI